jgi:GalNAc5-diNAcBac-PP-undecaprenol beta-1,3-glucosyltransferase
VLVSLVIPTYNRARLVRRAIASALSQTHRDVEVVVVDDGSTDETPAVLASLDDPRVRHVRHPVNRGVNGAKNTGLDNARGDWIGMLDSDDELVPEAIEVLLKKGEELGPTRNIGTLMCNCRMVPGDALSGKGITQDGFVSYDDFLGGRVHGEFWGIFSRRLMGARRFDERLRSFESLLWYQFYKESETYYVHQPLRLYYVNGGDSLSNIDNLIRSAAKVRLGYDELLAQRGGDLRARHPKRYAYFLRRKVLFEIISGARVRAAGSVLEALRYDATLEAVALTAAIGLPRAAVVGLLGLRSRLEGLRRGHRVASA